MPPHSRDEALMLEALRLAEQGLFSTDPNPRVGCVIARGDRVVGRGFHRRAGEAHAEILALQEAAAEARGADVYLTLEPCCVYGRTPPCTDSLVAAGVGRVLCATEDPDPRVSGRGVAALREAGIAVEVGLQRAWAETLNRGFFKRMHQGLPWVTVKLAASLDGRTAMASGESRWISGEASRADVQYWRARSGAILTGIGTVLADDPSLNVRRPDLVDRCVQPLRAVADSYLRLPEAARLLGDGGPVVAFTASPGDDRLQRMMSLGVQVEKLGTRDEQGVNLRQLLGRLGGLGANEVLVEAGPRLCGGLLRAGLVDRLLVYLAPHLMGDEARGMFRLPGLATMVERPALELADVRRVGADLRLECVPRLGS